MARARGPDRVPPTTIRRLSIYYRVLGELGPAGREHVSSDELGRLTGFSAAQVRRDLTYFGSFGRRGVGYRVVELQARLGQILGRSRLWRIGLIGVGNLGRALLSYRRFSAAPFEIVAAFDIAPNRVGAAFGGVMVRHVHQFAEVVEHESIDIVLVAVPASAAQDVVNRVVAAGVRAILNFAPTKVTVPAGVHLSLVDLSMEVEYLSYALTH